MGFPVTPAGPSSCLAAVCRLGETHISELSNALLPQCEPVPALESPGASGPMASTVQNFAGDFG